MNLCINLNKNQVAFLKSVSDITKISPEKIILSHLEENFFTKENSSVSVEILTDTDEQEIFKDEKTKLEHTIINYFNSQIKELELQNNDVAEFFKVTAPTYSKAINLIQKNIVYKTIISASADLNKLIKDVYFFVLEKNLKKFENKKSQISLDSLELSEEQKYRFVILIAYLIFRNSLFSELNITQYVNIMNENLKSFDEKLQKIFTLESALNIRQDLESMLIEYFF